MKENKGESAFIRGPQGKMTGLNHLLAEQKANGATEMNVANLKSGDLVVFKKPSSEEEKKEIGLVFEINKAKWEDLGIGGTKPNLKLRGKLNGLAVPKEVSDTEVEFRGSGYGGSARSFSVVASDRSPYFHLKGNGEVFASGFTYFETFRENKGLHPLSPNQLEREVREESVIHTKRLEQTERLVSLLGYDLRNDNQNVQPSAYNQAYGRDPIYEDNRYSIEYVIEYVTQDTNKVTVFDKQSNLWMQCKFLNNNDMLQIAIADLSEQEGEDVFRGKPRSETFRLKSIVTYNTSNRYGLEAINYTPSDQDAHEQLGVPYHTDHEIYPPDIQIFPNGQIDFSDTMYQIALENYPGLQESIESKIAYEQKADGTMQIRLGDKRLQLPDPLKLLQEVTSHIASQ